MVKGPAWRKAVDEVKKVVAGGSESVASLMNDIRSEVRRLTGAVEVAPLGKNAGDGFTGLKREVEEIGKRVNVALSGLKAIGGDVDVLGEMLAAMYKGVEAAEKERRKEKGKGVDFGGGSKVGLGFRF